MDVKNYDVIDPDFSQPDYLPPCDGGTCRPCPPMCPPPRPLPPCRPPKPGCTSNSTPWYGLPQWAAGDVTSWLMQMNGAMLRIDTIMHDLALRTGINGLPDDLVSCVAKVSQDVEVIKCTIGEMTNKQANIDLMMQNLNTQFSAMKTDVASLTLSVTNLDTRIMTVDSKADGMKNDIVLLKTDLNMLSKTVQNLTANFTSFQNSVNQSIAELQTSVLENTNGVSALNLTGFVRSTWNWDPAKVSEYNYNGYPMHFKDNPISVVGANLDIAEYGLYCWASIRTPSILKFAITEDMITNTSHRTASFRVESTFNTIGYNIARTWIRSTCMARIPSKVNGWKPVNMGIHSYFKNNILIFDYFISGGDLPGISDATVNDTVEVAMITGDWLLTKNSVENNDNTIATARFDESELWIEDWMKPIREAY